MGVGQRLSGADLRRKDLRGSDLRAADLRGSRLDDADLRGADLWAANVSNASLRRADLRGARLTQASFAGSDLRACKLAGADMQMTDLEGAHIACVDTGRPRKGHWVKLAQHHGWPSFSDAMSHYFSALHLRGGEVLWAIDAAADVSEDFMGELTACVRTAPRAAVPAAACVRVQATELASLVFARLTRCREFEVRTVAAASVYLGIPRASVIAAAGPRGQLGDLDRAIDTLLARVASWPAADELPPYRGTR